MVTDGTIFRNGEGAPGSIAQENRSDSPQSIARDSEQTYAPKLLSRTFKRVDRIGSDVVRCDRPH